jgi:4-hydroxy-2-oxoheptanedioate aldolase
MDRGNRLKMKIRAGQAALGCIVALPSADIAEIMAHAGFDFLFIDHEHGAGSLGDAIAQMRAVMGSGTTPIVRIPAGDAGYLQRVLDAGAAGVVLPCIESGDQAEAVVRACHFPPRGVRGAGGGTRASSYGFDPDFALRLPEDLLIGVQIETVRGVERIEEICNVKEIDVIVIGPRDLSASIGKLNQFQDPELQALIEQAEARILSTGKYLCSVVYPWLTVETMIERGYRMLMAGMDVNFLAQGAKTALLGRH